MINIKTETRKRLMTAYQNMKTRCYNSNCKQYCNYGGRGIKICDEWINSFDSFLNWSIQNGYADDLEIDRINNDGNYSPDNCRWVTRQENLANRGMYSSNKTGYTGVFYDDKYNKYKSYITAQGVSYRLGTYKTKREAIAARKAGEILLPKLL